MYSDLLLKECDCAIITSPASLYYVSGVDVADAVLILTKRGNYYLTNSLYEVAVKAASPSGFELLIQTREEQSAFIKNQVENAAVIGLEYDHITLAWFNSFFTTQDKTVDSTGTLAELRKIKSCEAREIIKQAESIVDAAFQATLPLLKPGISEKALRDALVANLVANGAEGTAFDTIVAFGENAAMPHAVPSERALREGDCVLMDFGAKYKGYCSDFTRTVHCGKPSQKFCEAYQTVLTAQRNVIAYLEKGGRSAFEADKIARETIDRSPFRGAFTHTLGHGVGIEIHEAPWLSRRSKDVLCDNEVFTIEPGVYLEGEFGVRIESLVMIENGKLTVIDRSDKEIYIV